MNNKNEQMIIVAMALSLFAIVGFAAFYPAKVQVIKVVAVAWERNISVEYLQTYIEEDWSVPCGGRVISSWISLKSYTTSHTATNSKGHSRTTHTTHWRPATKYKYEIDRWRHIRTEKARGEDFNPSWPTVTLGNRERKARSSQTYIVNFVGEDKISYEKTFDEAAWKEHKIGFTYRARQNIFGQILDLEDLK